ncbi:ABC-2 family transporter protein [Candidatus Woesearchaeota archaeon]|nr:ABC-2 family transporter protein [Candidatus Woesearchaeota archaeon]
MIKKFLSLEKKSILLALASDMAYKTNFYIKCFALVLADFIGPLMTILIYTTTLGIPGWTMFEFLFFQGTLILVFGFGHAFAIVLPYEVIDCIRDGEFDQYLVKPFNTLLYLISRSFELEGLAEMAAGFVIIVYSMIMLKSSIFSFNFLLFIVLVLVGCMIQIAAMIFISSIAFLAVRSDALMDLFFKVSDFARYPLSVYSFGIRFFLTFLFPIGVSSFYPAVVFLKGASFSFLASVLIPSVLFVMFSVILWNISMKSYTSAGG